MGPLTVPEVPCCLWVLRYIHTSPALCEPGLRKFTQDWAVVSEHGATDDQVAVCIEKISLDSMTRC